MIDNEKNPVEWALMLFDLDEARKHLEDLIDQMSRDKGIEEEDFAVGLGHVFAHLNRNWNSRKLEGPIPENEWSAYSQFPTDLDPVG